MIIYSKTYDYTNKLVQNFFISQLQYKRVNTNKFFKETKIVLQVKRVKNKVHLNIATLISCLILIYGTYPSLFIDKALNKDCYVFNLKHKKLYVTLDTLFFLIIPKLKKDKETIYKRNSTSGSFIDVYNIEGIYNLHSLDTFLSLLRSFILHIEFSNSFHSNNLFNYLRCPINI